MNAASASLLLCYVCPTPHRVPIAYAKLCILQLPWHSGVPHQRYKLVTPEKCVGGWPSILYNTCKHTLTVLNYCIYYAGQFGIVFKAILMSESEVNGGKKYSDVAVKSFRGK